ncbi:hypothetical protein OPIT5_15440 [Opitutaceae bacterium TAV5]|nr:hypothetical protein OPIT5_15440 [Opitutaceae bacterium TAV5]
MRLVPESIMYDIGSMKTTVDIPEKDLAEVMKFTKARTRTEAVSFVVADYNRRQRLARLAGKLGTFQDLITPEELQAIRASR